MGDIKIYSPFYKVRRTLILLRWVLGFPLKPTDDSFTSFVFIPRIEILRFFAVLSFPIILHAYSFLSFYTSDEHLENFVELYKGIYYHYSQSTMDHIVVVNWTVVIFIFLQINFFAFKNNATVINEFCNEFCLVKSNLESLLKQHDLKVSDEKEVKRNPEKIQYSEYLLIYGQTLNVLATCLFSTWLHEVIQIISNGRNFPILQGMSYFIFFFFYFLQVSSTLFGPTSCAVEVMICQFINETAILYEDWNKLLSVPHQSKIYIIDNKLQVDDYPKRRKSLTNNESSENTDVKTQSAINHHENLIDLGLSLEKLIVKANNTTRVFITACYFGSVASCVMIAFQLAAMVKTEDFNYSDERKLIIFGYIFSIIMYLIRLYFMMNSGQRLGISVIQSKRALEEFTLNYEEDFMLSRQYTSKLTTLQKRLDAYQLIHPISPYSVFSLSRKTFYSTLGIIITYIVLLVKLRDKTKGKNSINESTENQIKHAISEINTSEIIQ